MKNKPTTPILASDVRVFETLVRAEALEDPIALADNVLFKLQEAHILFLPTRDELARDTAEFRASFERVIDRSFAVDANSMAFFFRATYREYVSRITQCYLERYSRLHDLMLLQHPFSRKATW